MATSNLNELDHPNELNQTPTTGRPGWHGAASETRVGLLSFLTLFVIGTDTFLVAPLLPLLRHQFGVDVARSGWLVSGYALGYVACSLIAGPISDRVDRRVMLLGGMVAFTASTAACGLAPGFWVMLACRFAAGVTAACASPQIWASIPLLVAPRRIVATMGKATAGLALAQVAGIPIGAFLSSVSWHTPFLFVATLAAALTVVLAVAFPQVPRPASSGTPGGYRFVLTTRPLMLCLLAYLVFQTGNFGALSFYGSWLAKSFRLTENGIGVAMMVIGAGNAAGSLFGARLVARLGQRRSLLAGILAMTAGYVLTVPIGQLSLAVGLLMLVMAAGGFVFPVMMTVLQARAGDSRGTVAALSNAAMYAGVTLGAAVAGPLLAALPGFTGPAALAIAAYLLSLTVYAAAGALST